MATPIHVKAVKLGDFVRFVDSDSAPVWIRGEYERCSRTYSFIDYNNSCHERFAKGDRLVYVNFDF